MVAGFLIAVGLLLVFAARQAGRVGLYDVYIPFLIGGWVLIVLGIGYLTDYCIRQIRKVEPRGFDVLSGDPRQKPPRDEI